MNAIKHGSAIISILLAGPAAAHVEYYDLNEGVQIADLTDAGKVASQAEHGASVQQDLPLRNATLWNDTYQVSNAGVGNFSNVVYGARSGSASVTVNDVTDFGWGAGTQTTLGDSHKVDFFNFRLTQTSIVRLSWFVDAGAGTYVDSGFSIYRGGVVYQGHDDTSADPLNPVSDDTFLPIQNQVDTGLVIDAQGTTSPYRDTINYTTTGGLGDDGYPINPFVGQFDAFHSWSQANAAGDWAAAEFLRAVDDRHGQFGSTLDDFNETIVLQLQAGDYTVAASGALLPGSTSFGATLLGGHLDYSYSAVPLPGAHWLLATAVAGLIGGQCRRRASGSKLSTTQCGVPEAS